MTAHWRARSSSLLLPLALKGGLEVRGHLPHRRARLFGGDMGRMRESLFASALLAAADLHPYWHMRRQRRSGGGSPHAGLSRRGGQRRGLVAVAALGCQPAWRRRGDQLVGEESAALVAVRLSLGVAVGEGENA